MTNWQKKKKIDCDMFYEKKRCWALSQLSRTSLQRDFFFKGMTLEQKPKG